VDQQDLAAQVAAAMVVIQVQQQLVGQQILVVAAVDLQVVAQVKAVDQVL
tara:strand:+ start:767 stop:916 length:150 start_codon:yes stop_codon:yes gene_type:complete